MWNNSLEIEVKQSNDKDALLQNSFFKVFKKIKVEGEKDWITRCCFQYYGPRQVFFRLALMYR